MSTGDHATAAPAAIPRTVWALGIVSLLMDMSSEIIHALLPLFLTTTLGASVAMVGLIDGIAEATAAVVKVWSGWLSDVSGRRKPLILLGYGLGALSKPLFPLAHGPMLVLGARFVDRVGKGLRGAPRDALIADAAPEGMAARAFGFHRAMDHAGAVVGPLIAAGLLGLGLDMRTVFLCAAIPGALALATTLAVPERAPEPASAVLPPLPGPAGRLPPAFWRLLGLLALFGLGNSSDAFLLLRARELGVADALLPILWSAFHVSKVGWSFIGGALGDRMKRQHAIIAGWLVYAAVYLLLGLATAPWHAWALFLTYGAYFGLTEPVEKALVRDVVPADLRGSAFGWYNFTTGVMALPASLLIGAIWQATSALPALATGAALALSASIGLALLSSAQPPSAPPASTGRPSA